MDLILLVSSMSAAIISYVNNVPPWTRPFAFVCLEQSQPNSQIAVPILSRCFFSKTPPRIPWLFVPLIRFTKKIPPGVQTLLPGRDAPKDYSVAISAEEISVEK